MFDKDVASSSAGDSNDDWNRDLVNRLAFAAVDEQRRARRWGIFFKSLTFVYLFVMLMMFNRTFQLPRILINWGSVNAKNSV